MATTPTTRRRRAPFLGEEVRVISRFAYYETARVIGVFNDGWRLESDGEERFFDVPANHPTRRLFVRPDGLDNTTTGGRDDRLLRPGDRAYFEPQLACFTATVEVVVHDGLLVRIDEWVTDQHDWEGDLCGFSFDADSIWLPVESPSACPTGGESLVIPTADRWYLGEYIHDYERTCQPWDDDPLLALGHPFPIDDEPDRFRRFSMQADAARAACNRPERFVEGGPEAWWRDARFGRTGRPLQCRWLANLPADFVKLLDICHNSDLTHDAKHAHCERLIADLRAGRRTLTVPAGGPFVYHPFPTGVPVVQADAVMAEGGA